VHGPDQSMHMEAGPATRMHAAVAHDEATKVQYVYMRCVRTTQQMEAIVCRGRRSLARYIWYGREVDDDERARGAHARHVH